MMCFCSLLCIIGVELSNSQAFSCTPKHGYIFLKAHSVAVCKLPLFLEKLNYEFTKKKKEKKELCTETPWNLDQTWDQFFFFFFVVVE